MANYVKLPGLIKQLHRSGYPDIPLTKADEVALLEGCYFDSSAGWRPVDYIEYYCKISKGAHAGKKAQLLPWQTNHLLVPVFGWMLPSGKRRINKAITYIPKKNGKSFLASSLAAYLTDEKGDGEGGSEVYMAATTRDQASIVFKEAATLIESSPALQARFKVTRSTRTVTTLDNKSWMRALAAEANSSEGLNAHALILDELHAWKDADFYSALIWATAARENPLIFVISTAGSELHSIGGGEYEYAKSILKGDIEDTRVWPLIYEADASDDLDDIEVWKKSNPSLGHTIPIDNFRSDYKQAKIKGGKDWSDFKRYRFNIWGGADAPYLDAEKWKKNCFVDFDEKELYGQECYGGLDLSSREDITSLCFCFPNKETGAYRMIWRHWVPEDRVKERLDRGDKSYLKWKESGHLYTIPGSRIEQDIITRQLQMDFKKFKVQGMAVESWNAQSIIDELQKLIEEVLEVTPSYRHYSEPTKEFKALVDSGKIEHQGSPVMQWMISNLHVKENNFLDLMPIKKERKQKYKIDGCIAAILALKLALIAVEEAAFSSIYERDDLNLD